MQKATLNAGHTLPDGLGPVAALRGLALSHTGLAELPRGGELPTNLGERDHLGQKVKFPTELLTSGYRKTSVFLNENH